MIKVLMFFSVILIVSCNNIQKDKNILPDRTHKLLHYSELLQDTFVFDVYLPDPSADQGGSTYPVVFVLDGNLYFQIYASILKQYNSVGLLPKVILVGVGYPTFQKMDSLRQRDYTYPEAVPEYEMPVSGKGDRFRKAFTDEFVSLIDNQYPTNKLKRILMGHSLGGYFTLYSMYQDELQSSSTWSGYIAASPSLHYNNSYLLDKFNSLVSTATLQRKAFISYGGDEASEVLNETRMNMDSLLRKCATFGDSKRALKVQTALYSNLGHMDTQLPTFIKGLQWMLQDTATN